MMHLTLDLETVALASMGTYQPRDAKEGEVFPPAPFWSIAAMGYLEADDNLLTTRIVASPATTEADMVRGLVGYLEKTEARIYTSNGRGFDMPVLEAVCMRHGIQAPCIFAENIRDRYRGRRHVDLCEFFSNNGAARRSSVDAMARNIGLPGKLDAKGSDVAALVAAGEIDKVRAYVQEDVSQEWGIALRKMLVTGEIDLAKYQEAARSLLTAIDAKPELAKLAAGVDRGRFLLEAM